MNRSEGETLGMLPPQGTPVAKLDRLDLLGMHDRTSSISNLALGRACHTHLVGLGSGAQGALTYFLPRQPQAFFTSGCIHVHLSSLGKAARKVPKLPCVRGDR